MQQHLLLILVIILLAICIVAFTLIYSHFARKVKKLEETLDSFKVVLNKKEDNFMEFTDRMLYSNQKIEQLLHLRSKELEDKKGIISDYAFNNNHILRAPVARLIGLTHLMSAMRDEEGMNEIIKRIHIESVELDKIFNNLNHQLKE